MKRNSVVAIVPSAGCGRRLGLKKKKPFVLLGGKPIVAYALASLQACPEIDAIIIAAEKSCIENFKKLAGRFSKVIAIIAGGKTRYESVKNCLRAIGPSFEIALIHDGARPFVDRRMVKDAVKLAVRYGASVAAVPESDTVKLSGRSLFIVKTLDRQRIFRIQTPQAFRMSVIRKAYFSGRKKSATDDAGLVEAIGGRVKIFEGSYRNMKITTKEDLKLAEVFL